MKNFTKKMAALLLALALLCGPGVIAANASPADTHAGKTFVVLGDSIAAGIGAAREEYAYARLVADELGLTLAKHAVPGHTSSDLLNILAEDEAAKQSIRQADIINVSIGGNDLLAANVIRLLLRILTLNDDSGLDPVIEAFQERFALIVEQLRALNSDALLIVQTPYNAMERVPFVENAYEAAALRLRQVLYDYLAQHPGAFVIGDVFSAFKGREGLISNDRLHPSDAGHAMIARVVSAAITGETLQLEPPPEYTPTLWQQIVFFIRAFVDYFRHFLSYMSVWDLIRNAIRFF